METNVTSSALSRSCLEGFIDLCKSLKGLANGHRFSNQISLVDTEDELGRFRVWAGNIGALQTGHSSLEYRLREASLVLQNVLKLLNELKALLHEITVVTSGIRLPYDEQILQNGSDSEDDFDFGEIETDQDEAPKTELERNYLSTVDIIDNLYKLSIYIRNPTSRTRFSKAASFQVVDPESGVDLLGRYQDFDIEHVRHVFQDLRREFSADVRYQQSDLIERLGRAITRRRQLFMYWKRHRDKLSAKLSAKTEPVKDYKIEPSQAANIDGEATLLVGAHLNGDSPAANKAHSEKTKSAFTATTATLFVHRDDHPDDLQSMISSATTARGLDGGRASLPPPPKVPLGKDFECPYCFTICPAKYLNERNWRVHLLKDLQPYVCTYARCDSGSQLYSSRHEWISHETHAHRKKWRCPAHPQVEYASQKDYAMHLEQEHEQVTGSSNLPTMLDIGETTSNEISRVCPLCLIEEPSSDRFYNHIAFHLESIAAFSLPKNTAGPEGDTESVRTASTNANRGSQGSESFETLSAFEEEPQRLFDVGGEAVSMAFKLFSSCVRGYQVISVAGGLPVDAKYLQVRLRIEGHRLITWAEGRGLKEEKDFSNLFNSDLVCEILHRKKELLRNYVKAEMQPSTEPNTVGDVQNDNEDVFQLLAKSLRLATEGGREYPDTIRWASFDKKTFGDLIVELRLLNDGLMELLETGTPETLLQTTREDDEVDRNLRRPQPRISRELRTPDLELKDGSGDDIQSLGPSWGLIEYGADPIYATGFEKERSPRLPANTDESGSEEEALLHGAPPSRVKFSASGDIESEVKHLEVKSDKGSMPPDDQLPIPPGESGPSTTPEKASSPRIPLQAPPHLSVIETPFVNAVLQGDTLSAKRILENSIVPRLKDYDLRHAVNSAVENEDYSMAEMLMDVGEANRMKRHSWKSLHAAAGMGNLRLVDLLVQRGVAVNAKNDEDRSNPLHKAAKHGHKQIVDRLMSLAVVTQGDSGVNEMDYNGMLPLHFAARHAHETTAGTLIMASNINQQNDLGRTPLIEAARSGADQIVKLLLGNGADVNSKDEEGRTALHEVVYNGHALIFDMLLAAGADVESKTSFGWTPLHYVFNHKETTIARMLLEKGADVNACTTNGETPLHLVAGVPKQHRLVNLFLREGADPNLVSHPFGLDAYERQSPLRTACSVLGNVETVLALIEGGADIDADTIRTGTALQAACQSGDIDIINLLIDHGAYVGAPRPLAPSPLQEAARNGHLEIVQLLLNKDADIDEQSDVLGTALEAACRGGHPSVAEFLIRRGANLTARDAYGQRDKYGRTCVDLAIAQGDIGLAQFLVNVIQDSLGFEHRDALAAEEKLKSALESRDDIEGHSSEVQQRTSRDTRGSDASTKSLTVPASQRKWMLRDDEGNETGPYSGSQMNNFYNEGLIPHYQEIKPLEEQTYQTFSQFRRGSGNLRDIFLVPHAWDPRPNPEENAVGRKRDRSSQSNPERLARGTPEENTKSRKRDRSSQSNPEHIALGTPAEDWVPVKPCTSCNGTGTKRHLSENFQIVCIACGGKGVARREGRLAGNVDSSSDSDTGWRPPQHSTQSPKERVDEDTNTLSNAVLQAREQLLQAMEKPEDRSLLLRHENKILRFINSIESMGDCIDEGPRSPHSEMLIKALARYYGLRPLVSRADNHLKLYRGDETIRPARLWMLESLQSASSVVEFPQPSETGIESDNSSSDAKLERPRSPSYSQTRFSDGRDVKLVEAMNNENDRSFLLRIERRIIEFVEQEKDGYVDLPRGKAPDRILIRRLAEYYGLSYSLVNEPLCVRLQRISDARLRLPTPLSELDISLPSDQDPNEPDQRRNSTGKLDIPNEFRPSARGILKQPKAKFPETANAIREGVAPLKESGGLKGIPPGARWTKIDRRLVSPAALEEARERFEERMDYVIVLRVLTREEVSKFAVRTQEIRDGRVGSDAASEDETTSLPDIPTAQKREIGGVRPGLYEGLLRHSDITADAQIMMGAVPDSEMFGEAVGLSARLSEDASELPLRQGQVVEVQRRSQDRPGWLEATYKLKHGVIPESHLLLTRLLGEIAKRDPEADAKVGAFELRQSHRRAEKQKKKILPSDDELAETVPTTQSDSDASSDEGPTEDASTSAQYNPDESTPGLSEHIFGTVMTLQLRDNMRATTDNDMRGNAITLMDFEVSDPGYGHPNEMPLSRGQRIDIISRHNEEYLNIRDRHGREGVVPESFVVLTGFLSYVQEDYLDRIFSGKHGHTGAPLIRAPLLKGEEDMDQLPTTSAPKLSSSSAEEHRGSSQVRANPFRDPRTLDYREIDYISFAGWWKEDQAIKEQQGLIGPSGRQASQQFDGATRTREERDEERGRITEAYNAYKAEMRAKMSAILREPLSDVDHDDPETKEVPSDTEDGFYAEATSDFVPQHESQMGLQKGRLVWVECLVDDQWALAQNTDTDGTRIVSESRLVPRSFLFWKEPKGKMTPKPVVGTAEGLNVDGTKKVPFSWTRSWRSNKESQPVPSLTTVEELQSEFCPPLNAELVAAVAHAFDLREDGAANQARLTLNSLKESAEAEESSGFDRSGRPPDPEVAELISPFMEIVAPPSASLNTVASTEDSLTRGKSTDESSNLDLDMPRRDRELNEGDEEVIHRHHDRFEHLLRLISTKGELGSQMLEWEQDPIRARLTINTGPVNWVLQKSRKRCALCTESGTRSGLILDSKHGVATDEEVDLITDYVRLHDERGDQEGREDLEDSNDYAYLFFAKEQRRKVHVANPGVKADEVGKILREQWKDMSEQERKPYEKMAEAYVERFDFQKAR